MIKRENKQYKKVVITPISKTFESSKYELVMREKEAEKTLDKQRKEDEKNEVQ